MKEQLISLDTAKLAKEKGFDIYTGKAWIKKENQELFFTSSYTGITDGIVYHRPTQSLLQKWLREIHNIDMNISKDSQDIYHCMIYTKARVEGPKFSKTYEGVLEKGLQEALKII